MPTKTIKARSIGWMVEFRANVELTGKWITFRDVPVRPQKSLAIGEFTRRCKFVDIPETIRRADTAYRWLKYRGLARCKGVYMEVFDAD